MISYERQLKLMIISFFLLGETSTSDPVLDCFSDDPPYKRIQISPDLAFHWKISDDLLIGRLNYKGMAWISLGFSADGSMVGSDAIIGQPSSYLYENNQSVFKYNLDSKSIDGVVPMTEEVQTLQDSYVLQDINSTELYFTKSLKEKNGEIPVARSGSNYFLWAVGRSNTFGYHKESGSFKIDLSNCDNHETIRKPIIAAADGMSGSSGSSGYNKKAMTVHGVLAALAWNLFAPVSISTAWFRRLIPNTWIYLHVVGNLSTYFFTLFAFWIAFTETSNNPKVSHFSKPHHIVGLIIMVLATFQVVLGFARPAVKKEDVDSSKSSPRWAWYMAHSTIGLSLLFASVYQTYSGLVLFSNNFGLRSVLPSWYWTLTVIFICLLFMVHLSISLARGVESSKIQPNRDMHSRKSNFRNPNQDFERPVM